MIIKVCNRLFQLHLDCFRIRRPFGQQATHQDTISVGIDPLGQVKGGIQILGNGEQTMPRSDHSGGILSDGVIPALK